MTNLPQMITTSSSMLLLLLGLYIVAEILYAIVYYTYMLPYANTQKPSPPYRDYPHIEDRVNLMLRIMHRIEQQCQITHQDETTVMKQFLTEWFHIEKKKNNKNVKNNKTEHTAPNLALTPSVSPDNSDNDDDDDVTSNSSNSCGSSDDDHRPSTTTKTTPAKATAVVVEDKIINNNNKDMDDGNIDINDVILYREDMNEFFAWAFFAKQYQQLDMTEIKELERIYQELQSRHEDLIFPYRRNPSSSQSTIQSTSQSTQSQSSDYICKARCMTLEPMRAVYRPLLVYILVSCMKVGAGIILRLYGFQRIVSSSTTSSSTKLVAWHRPAATTTTTQQQPDQQPQSSSLLPLLFFHGIAPGGFALYLPLVLFGFATEPNRPVFLFENRSISCCMDFQPLTEEQTVDGVVDILRQCHMEHTDVTLMGHSFGSCTITWLVAAAIAATASTTTTINNDNDDENQSTSNSIAKNTNHRRRHHPFTNSIKQIVLIDPVAILLSEPDVMVNFLYSNEVDKIRAVASSELFTEMYLRRHFAWYNSELYLEDVAKLDGCQTLVALSEKDEIINAKKVKQEIERHIGGDNNVTDLIYWKQLGHGAAVPLPSKWREVKQHMVRQEESIVAQESKKSR